MMIQKTILTSLFLLTLTTASWGADHLLIFGAGGEAPKEDTIFDGGIKKLGEYVKANPALKIDLALNGGHVKTERLINESFPTASTKSNFLESDYDRLIDSYKLKIKNDMLPGEQLMIFIDSHGALQEKGSKAHKIATSEGTATNLNNLTGSTLVDLNKLSVLKKLAKDKGIKLAIIDSSCHSGSSLDLADDNTCVITATGPDHYGYAGFSESLVSAMKKGKNLEEVFLETRSMEKTPGLPMISTKVGVDINSALYEKITPFLYSFDLDGDKLTPFLRANSSEYQQCIADQNFNSLISTINSVEEINTVANKVLAWTTTTKEVDLSYLKTLLTKYKTSLDLVRAKSRELGTDRLIKEELISVNIKSEGYTSSVEHSFSWKDLITTDFDSLIGLEQRRLNNEANPANRASLLAMKTLYTQAKAKKESLIRAQPDLLTISSKEDSISSLIEANYWTVADIAKEERKLYSALYKNAQKKQLPSQPNPCRDFKI